MIRISSLLVSLLLIAHANVLIANEVSSTHKECSGTLISSKPALIEELKTYIDEKSPSELNVKNIELVGNQTLRTSFPVCLQSISGLKHQKVGARTRLKAKYNDLSGKSFQDSLWVIVEATKSIWRAKEDIEQYSNVSKDQFYRDTVSYFERSLQGTVAGAFNDSRLLTPLTKNQALFDSQIVSIKAVTTGDIIDVLLDGDFYQIQARAKALSSGNQNEKITAKLLTSNKEVKVVVKDKGLALYD
ncbi:flagella basal body P-ring formation protein FlgA [Pleionea sediminis]|uniref:flagella basal body P-ring formation protein FlgA n=1 Tax=Pleionea sediminis TaxID=2569479 RepID=UPI0011866B75|nr:flagella basal body P-ring formation protein FlgA [Pleionea sediminis]